MAEPVNLKRRYTSPRREEQARATRERILEAAYTRFTRDGYVATPVNAIADEAGVATPTVYAVFGTKPAIFTELVVRAIFGSDPAWSSPAQRPWYRDLAALADPRQILRRHVSYIVTVNQRFAPMQLVAEAAAGADAEIAALWERAVRQRMQGQRAVAALLQSRGGLGAGVTVDRAADLIWALTDARLYHSLVVRRRWSSMAFEEWLLDSLENALLA